MITDRGIWGRGSRNSCSPSLSPSSGREAPHILRTWVWGRYEPQVEVRSVTVLTVKVDE